MPFGGGYRFWGVVVLMGATIFLGWSLFWSGVGLRMGFVFPEV
jgi:hypothetical protein